MTLWPDLGVHVYAWETTPTPRGVVQIVHGMAEHAGRYARLASALTAAGHHVYAHDQRGHGRTAPSPDLLGHFGDANGWRILVEDAWRLSRRLRETHPGLPLVLLGHSMGSFVAQTLMGEHGAGYAGVVLCATSGPPPAAARAGQFVARVERTRLGRRGRSALLHWLAFHRYNARFAPARTPFDWLSRDEEEVDRYIADPYCGFRLTTQSWRDFVEGLFALAAAPHLARVPRALPILVLAGTMDPLSRETRALRPLLDTWKRAGLTRVTSRFYEGARHELFNETNRDEVTRDLVAWINLVGAGLQPGP